MELTKKNSAKIYVNVDNILYTQNQYLNFQSGTLLEVADVDEVRFNNSEKYKNGFINVDKIESFERYGAKTEVLFLTGNVISFEDFEVIKYLSRPTDFVISCSSQELIESRKHLEDDSRPEDMVLDKTPDQLDIPLVTEQVKPEPVKPKTTRKRTKKAE
jgi:hypothetical protein